MSADFDTFTIVRSFKCTPAQLFKAWADIEARAVWFVGPPPDWQVLERTMDFREGGAESLKGEFPGRLTTQYNSHFYEIIENERISHGYEVRLNDRCYSVSAAVIEISEGGLGAEMKYTELIAYLDGDTKEATKGRIKGTNDLFDRLEKYLS